ncbi:MAG TPA: adenosylcobinamide-GDP ribazoletransferase [Syntrophales bacterium]|nr:adenosylcobinamide-GDP ribazoletransferase [Syntrophales bacterium]
MKPFLAAIQFLTVFPFPKSFVGGEKELEKSVPYFPVVGLLIGIIIAAFDHLICFILPFLPASVITVIALTSISGGLHMDGLADTADGFFSARPRERVLEIMRDSRTGVMGVVAVVFVIILKISLLMTLSAPLRFGIILLMPLAGRCSLVMMMRTLSYVRHEGGLATVFGKGRSWLNVLWSSVFLFAVGWIAEHGLGLAASTLSLLAAALFLVYCFRKIGGYTGDTLGAVCEITEIIPALAAVTMSRIFT